MTFSVAPPSGAEVFFRAFKDTKSDNKNSDWNLVPERNLVYKHYFKSAL